MSQALFKDVSFSLSFLVEQIAMGHIGLPDLQRPFVWPNKKVRDLFDSMYRGYPVGYLLLWQNGATHAGGNGGPNHKSIGVEPKQRKVPDLLVIDGQQRLTSLFAVLKGIPVVREDFSQERIEIAFRPLDGSFEVTDAAMRKDPTWLPDISVVWNPASDIFELVGSYLDRISATRTVDAEERKAIGAAFQRLMNLTHFPFMALELSADIDEEQVAEVFVRINSKGTPLNQADFILTLMSVFREEQRRELEAFCRASRVPTTGKASPFNHFIEPDPDHLLRVAVGLGFRRARLQHVYSILRGKDLETGKFSEERRQAQFDVLEQAQKRTLDLLSWHEFLKTLARAGFRSGRTITSRTALLYVYVFFLLGRHDYGIELQKLKTAIARWFFFASLTSRYTGSSEARMEQDLADLREVSTADAFLAHLERQIAATLTPDYWQITLPNELVSSSARSPALFAYYAALNLLDAPVLFSGQPVRDLMDPSMHGTRSALERHHLFPKAYLAKLGIRSRREVNQIANYALLEWPDNNKIGATPPSEYFEKFAKPHAVRGELDTVCFLHALPPGWESMEYHDFLARRRVGIAQVIRRGFESLATSAAGELEQPVAVAAPTPLVAAAAVAADGRITTAVLEHLPPGVRSIFEELLDEPLADPAAVAEEIEAYLARLEERAASFEFIDLDTARHVADRCVRVLRRHGDGGPEERRRLAHAAARYFLLAEDADSDFESIIGFDDDQRVVATVDRLLASASR